ncbi:MAG TPA: hypothetical protein VFF42_04125 [Candidatus Eremiobacteraceae bacterium]|jgi:hypothetical protein|nr:hypothetical protein [Candidatus Eremiobacteraceae bacterium]
MSKTHWLTSLIIILIASTFSMAQSQNTPPVSTVIAVLTKPLDSKSAIVGQELVLITLTDVVVRGEKIIPMGSQLLAETAAVSKNARDDAKSVLAIKIDKAITRKGDELPLQAIIAAIGAPVDDSLTADPQYGMLHSNEPKMSGVSPGTTASTGGLGASSKTSSTAAVATAEMKGVMDRPLLLNENSQGAIGYEGVSLSWYLAVPPPLTFLVSKSRNIKLKAGTQMLLRMAEPRVAR